MSEQILVFPAYILEELGKPSGFNKKINKYFNGILKQENLSFIDRDAAEKDPSFKQIIPYQLLKNMRNDEYFVYKRGKKGGENRLHAKLSLGIGGHINDTDSKDLSHPITTYVNGMDRELNEEVQLDGDWYEKLVGVLYDDDSPVGKVHFGFVHIYEIDDTGSVEIIDEALDVEGWYSKEKLVENIDKFELWSQLVIREL